MNKEAAHNTLIVELSDLSQQNLCTVEWKQENQTKKTGHRVQNENEGLLQPYGVVTMVI